MLNYKIFPVKPAPTSGHFPGLAHSDAMKDLSAVLVTGSSSGIGLATCHEMKKRGWRVLATARKAADLDRLRAEGFETVAMEMDDPASVAEGAAAALALCGGKLEGLVNNAGYGQPGALEDLSVTEMRRQFEVNVIGLQDLTNRILPGMIRQGAGRVVHVSSVVGRVALPFMGIYSASKFAVEALADAQRVELRGTGVKLSLVEPGPIITRFSQNAVQSAGGITDGRPSRFARLYQSELAGRANRESPKAFALPPEAVAVKIAHALTSPRPRRRYQVTLPAYLGAGLSRLAPDALIDWMLGQELKKRMAFEGAVG